MFCISNVFQVLFFKIPFTLKQTILILQDQNHKLWWDLVKESGAHGEFSFQVKTSSTFKSIRVLGDNTESALKKVSEKVFCWSKIRLSNHKSRYKKCSSCREDLKTLQRQKKSIHILLILHVRIWKNGP